MVTRTKHHTDRTFTLVQFTDRRKALETRVVADLHGQMVAGGRRPIGKPTVTWDEMVWLRPAHGRGEYEYRASYPDLDVAGMKCTVTQNSAALIEDNEKASA